MLGLRLATFSVQRSAFVATKNASELADCLGPNNILPKCTADQG